MLEGLKFSSGPDVVSAPLYIIVPEQHTLTIEHQLLEMLNSMPGSRRAYTGLQVTSFTRLGRMLNSLSADPPGQISELGRRLMAWRLLEGQERQPVRAAELARLFGELGQYGANWEDLEGLAQGIGVQGSQELSKICEPGRLPSKLASLARYYSEYCAWCERLGLQVRSWTQEISLTALRSAEAGSQAAANPFLRFSRARLWIDGFMGMTPPELAAVQALLQVCSAVTLTLLLDPELALLKPEEQALHPASEYYEPTLELLSDWRVICRDAGVRLAVETHRDTPRRFTKPALSELAAAPLAHKAIRNQQPPAVEVIDTPSQANGKCGDYARGFACSSVRSEIDLACRTVLELVQQRGWRFKDICLLARSLDPIAQLLQARLADYSIPAHLDRKTRVGGHPLIEYVRCALRLALDSAQQSDLTVLLNTGLLPALADADHMALQRLELVSRQRRIRPVRWLDTGCWEEQYFSADSSRRVTELDPQACWVARQNALPQIIQLSKWVKKTWDAELTVVGALTQIWLVLLGSETQELVADGDLPVLEQLRALWEEIAAICAGLRLGRNEQDTVSWYQFQHWLEFGLEQLVLRPPPAATDQLVVSEVEKGRVPPAKGVLILGMAEDCWLPESTGQQYFSENERLAILEIWRERALTRVGYTSGLLAPGAAAKAQREPYIALVAATRASEFVQFSYTAQDRERKPRRPSRYFNWLARALHVDVKEYHGLDDTDPSSAMETVYSPHEAAMLAVAGDQAQQDQAQLVALVPERTKKLIGWRVSANKLERMIQAKYWSERLLTFRRDKARSGFLLTTATQLEMFSNCPYKFFARYAAGLAEPDDPELGSRLLGMLYHDALRRLLEPIADDTRRDMASGASQARLDWTSLAKRIPVAIDASIAELELHEDIERIGFVKQRCEAIITYLLAGYARCAIEGEERWPLSLEAGFGFDAALPPALLKADGITVGISGKLDRLDLHRDQSLAVVDYKLGQRNLSFWRINSGLELQLPVYLLALRSELQLAPGMACRQWPLSHAEYQPVELRFTDGKAKLEPVRIPTKVMVDAARKQPGLDPMGGLLGHVSRVILENAVQMQSLSCDPLPARNPRGDWTACSYCKFKPICRFDRHAGGRFNQAVGIGRKTEDVQAWLAAGTEHLERVRQL